MTFFSILYRENSFVGARYFNLTTSMDSANWAILIYENLDDEKASLKYV